ncbi:MAG: metallophosphoesterase [Ruminococcus flavefaciens]|nr:metallophosphoesterase [Ruminococcus flavefaciens]
MKYFVVADVHGFYDLMIKALTEKGYFEEKKPHKLVICGDLFDRGLQAKEMEKFVVDLLEKDEVILIRGNHEDLMLDLVNRLDEFVDMGIEYTHHYSNRTVQTLMDLTGCSFGELKEEPRKVAERMRATPFLKTIIPAMLDYYETEKYIFVHGWIPCQASGYGGAPGWYKYQKDWRDAPKSDWMLARWYNGMLAAWQECIEPGKTIVCGHWCCSYGHTYLEKNIDIKKGMEDFKPYCGNGIIAIDATTAKNKVVNCIVIEDEEKRA